MTDQDIELRAKLLAHSYLIEVAIGTLISNHPQPTRMIEKLRFDLVAQLRADHQAGGPAFPSPDAEAVVVDASTDYLYQMFDRLASQFELQPPPRHNA